MNGSINGYMPIFRTGRLHEFLLVENSLKENGIPYIRQENNISGLNMAPACPASAPGVYWSIFVPDELEETAKEILSSLPIDISSEPPDLWHFSSDENVKSGFRTYAVAALALFIAIMFLDVIIELFKSLF